MTVNYGGTLKFFRRNLSPTRLTNMILKLAKFSLHTGISTSLILSLVKEAVKKERFAD